MSLSIRMTSVHPPAGKVVLVGDHMQPQKKCIVYQTSLVYYKCIDSFKTKGHKFTYFHKPQNVLESHFPRATQLIPGQGSELSLKVVDVIHWHSHCPLRERVWLSSVNERCQRIQIKWCWSPLMKWSLFNGQMIFMTRGRSAIDPFMATICLLIFCIRKLSSWQWFWYLLSKFIYRYSFQKS